MHVLGFRDAIDRIHIVQCRTCRKGKRCPTGTINAQLANAASLNPFSVMITIDPETGFIPGSDVLIGNA